MSIEVMHGVAINRDKKMYKYKNLQSKIKHELMIFSGLRPLLLNLSHLLKRPLYFNHLLHLSMLTFIIEEQHSFTDT